MSFLKKFEEKTEKILDVVGSILFVALIISTFFNIFSYWFTGKRFAEFDEIGLAIFLWVVFIATGTLYKHGEHIGVTFIVENMKPRKKSIVNILIDIIVLVTTVFVIYYTWKLMKRSFSKYTQVLKIPYVYIDAGVLFGYISLFISSLAKLIVHFAEARNLFAKKEGIA